MMVSSSNTTQSIFLLQQYSISNKRGACCSYLANTSAHLGTACLILHFPNAGFVLTATAARTHAHDKKDTVLWKEDLVT